jgi:hypothetical protein
VAIRRISTADAIRVRAMSRREFLTLSTSRKKRVVELSCEGLYMQYVDARSNVGRWNESGQDSAGLPSSEEEPPTEVETPATSELFEKLESKLAGAEVVRVHGREWLSDESFTRRVEACLEAFRRRGGRVEFRD